MIKTKKQRKLVEAWIELHQDELNAAWYALNNDGEIIKIKGLEILRMLQVLVSTRERILVHLGMVELL